MNGKLLTITLFLVSFSFAQQRTCGVDEATERIYFNPILKQKQSELQQKFENELGKLNQNQNRNASNNNVVNSTIFIPVAVHYPSAGSA